MSNVSKSTRALVEGAICVALAIALSYAKIPIGVSVGGFGGSIDLVMIPLIVYAMRWGCAWGVGAGFIFGTLKYFFANGTAISWVSIIFDYSVAYAFVGFAGLLHNFAIVRLDRLAHDAVLSRAELSQWKYRMLPLAALIGCLCRFVVHFLSGVTVYAQYMPEEFLGVTNLTPGVYSVLFNGTYMLPNTIIALVVCALLIAPVQRLPKAG